MKTSRRSSAIAELFQQVFSFSAAHAGGMVCALVVVSLQLPTRADAAPVYPPSTVITDISFDMSTLRNVAPGNGVTAPESDNWTITWADDGHQYTSFGDGIGFATSNNTRGSFGVSRIEGGKNNYSAYDVWKTGNNSGGPGGKSYGIISIDSTLYLWRCNATAAAGGAERFKLNDLWKSTNHGSSWSQVGVQWHQDDWAPSDPIFCPTFLQFGQDYAGARDNYVYTYAPHRTQPRQPASDDWEVQLPGRITLMRVDKGSIENQAAYEYLAGFSGGQPVWTSNLQQRIPVFEDNVNGVMRTSVSYNPGLQRYILVTQQVSRFRASNFHIGIYEAPEPWGPWSTVLLTNPDTSIPGGLNTGAKTVYWNFSNKWLSADGKDFVMVYTGNGPDEWGTVEGSFTVTEDPNPSVTLDASPLTVIGGGATSLTWSSTDADACTASGGWSGSRATSNATGETSSSLSVDTTFTLTCTNSNGSGSDSVTVTIEDPTPVPTVSLSADPSTVVSGGTTLLRWSSTDADACTASGGWSGSRSTDNATGEASAPLSSDTTFTLTCANSTGSGSDSVTVTTDEPIPVPTVSLSADPSTVGSGGTTILSWSSIDADTCAASGGWSGARAKNNASGVTSAPLSSDTTFTLTCTNSAGSGSDSVTVTVDDLVPAPSVTLTSEPSTVANGETAVLRWSSADADTCTASGGWSGPRATNNTQGEVSEPLFAETTFVLTCSNVVGSSMDIVTVAVAAVGDPVVNLSANAASFASGESVALTWNPANAEFCEASGSWSGFRNSSGDSEVFGPLLENASFTLTCSNSIGVSAIETVNVTINGIADPPLVDLTATPLEVQRGGSTTLTWSSSNTDSCEASGDWSGPQTTESNSGRIQSNLMQNQTYIITCVGPGGASSDIASVTVTQPLPSLSFMAVSTNVESGGSTTLVWGAANAVVCSASGDWSGQRASSGSETLINPGSDASYTLTCTGEGGSVADTVNVLVFVPDPADVDNDGLLDDWEMTYFGNLDQGPNDDQDDDGFDNLTEFQKGSSPTVFDVADNDTDNNSGGGGAAGLWSLLWFTGVLLLRRQRRTESQRIAQTKR